MENKDLKKAYKKVLIDNLWVKGLIADREKEVLKKKIDEQEN